MHKVITFKEQIRKDEGGLEKENHRDNVDDTWSGDATQTYYRKGKGSPPEEKKDNTNLGGRDKIDGILR